MLREKFTWLYDILLRKLSDILKGPVGFAPHLGLPGFHIFLSDPGFAGLTDEGIDQQVNHADWLEKTRDDPSFVSSPVHIDTAHLIVEWHGFCSQLHSNNF